MFAEMLIHFRFGKFLHHPYVLLLGEVMPNFSGDHAYACMCVCLCVGVHAHVAVLINILSRRQ